MREALESRYEDAVLNAKARGAETALASLQTAGDHSQAVIAMPISRLRELVSTESSLYSNYHLQVRAAVRQASDPENDRMRIAVDGSLYGTAAEKIIFAALSLNGVGLKSYGPVTITLKDVAVRKRATVLEENSWTFIAKHDAYGKSMPPGFLSTWEDRAKLIVAKLADQLPFETASFSELVMTQGTGRQHDQFLEVHIYGSFNLRALNFVTGPNAGANKLESVELLWIREKLTMFQIGWREA